MTQSPSISPSHSPSSQEPLLLDVPPSEADFAAASPQAFEEAEDAAPTRGGQHDEPSPPRLSFVDMHTHTLGLVHTRTNAHANVDLKKLPGWPGAAPLHTLLLPSGKKVYVSYMGSPTDPVGLAVIKIRSIDFDHGHADVEVVKDLRIDPPGAPSGFPAVTQTSPEQPIASWTISAHGQLHAPQLLPGSRFAYFNMWTDNRIFALDTKTDELKPAQTFGALSSQLHGIHFNPSGKLGLSAGYFYDMGTVTLFRPNRHTGALTQGCTIHLGDAGRYAAYVHTVIWLNDRFALAGTMQFGPTSLTPRGVSIIGPSVWLIDTCTHAAEMIIGTARTPEDPGVLRSASYLALAGRRLFVAEEDSLDGSFGDDGFVSVYDLKDPRKPDFIKRLSPGKELPADFNVAHAFSVTPDNRTVFLESYSSGYIVKIDAQSLKVLHVDHHDHSHDGDTHGGLVMPHGAWIAGGH
jgi:hypothetical protein